MQAVEPVGRRRRPMLAKARAWAEIEPMAKWYEGAEEAAFKPVADGFVFQPPGLLWPFTRSRAYVLIVLGFTLAVGMSGSAQQIPSEEFIAIVIVAALAVVPIVIAPHIYLV